MSSSPDLNALLRLGRLEEARDQLVQDPQSVYRAPQPERLIHDLLNSVEGIPADQPVPWSEVLMVLTILIDEGLDPNREFPLERAVQLRDPCVAQLLLESRADPNLKASEGKYLQPRGQQMRALLRRFGAKSRNDPEVVIRERCVVRDEDNHQADLFMMNIEGHATLLRSTPQERVQHRYARAWLEVGQYERALRFLEQLVERDAGDVLAQQLRAWILATCPEERLRDGSLALRLADDLKQRFLAAHIVWENDGSDEKWHHPGPAEALAAALAEQKHFQQALGVLNEVDLDKVHPGHLERLARMRACFEASQPFRDGPPALDLAELGRRLAEEERLCRGAAASADEANAGQDPPEFVIEAGCLEIRRKGFGVEGVRRLLAEPGLAEVTSLRIAMSGLAVEEVLLLAEGLVAPGLTALDLSSNCIRDKAGAVLLAVTRWPELRELVLDCNKLGRRSAEAIASNPALGCLTILNVRRNHFRTRGAAALAASPHLGNLEELNLNYNLIRDEGLCRLAASSSLRSLNSLRLVNNRLKARGLEALARSPLLLGLELLDLGSNGLDDAAARALATAPRGRLVDLNLWNNRIGSPGVVALAASSLLDSVRRLTLSDNPIGVDGVRALAACPHLANLETLSLSDCTIDEEAATALAESVFLDQLQELHVSRNLVSEQAQTILRERFGDILHF